MKTHMVMYEFLNRIRLCDKKMGEDDDTVNDIEDVTCKKCIKIYNKLKNKTTYD